MTSRPKRAEPRPAPRLYLVTPPVSDTAAFVPELTAALRVADVAAVLARLAEADERSQINRIKALAPATQAREAALVVDGHADLVARAGADGAHLSDITAFTTALERLKPDRITGAGELKSRHEAMVAAEAGADYVMFGDDPRADFAATEERIAWWAEVFEVPCVAYARELGQIPSLIAAGADFIALDFVWSDPRGASTAIAEVAARLRLPEAVS